MAYGYSQSRFHELNFCPDVRPGFPLIIDRNSLAFRLGVKRRTLEFLLVLRNSGPTGAKNYRLGKERPDGTLEDQPFLYAYKCFSIKKLGPRGEVLKERPIQEPMPALKNVQRSLNGMLSGVPYPKAVIAYVRGLGIADAVEQHVRDSLWVPAQAVNPESPEHEVYTKTLADRRYKIVSRPREPHLPGSEPGWFFYQPLVEIHLDLRNFFNSIRSSWIREFFTEGVGYSHQVAWTLAQLCTVKWDEKRRFLPQGSPISGSVANLVAWHRFGSRVEEYLKTKSPDWVFTIYSDDISLTHPDLTISQEEIEQVRDDVARLVEATGFKINQEKTRITRSKNSRIKILGCVINERLNVEKSTFHRTRRLVCSCIDHGWISAERGEGEKLRQYLVGKMQSIRQIRQDRFETLWALYQEALVKHPPSAEKRETHDQASAAARSPQASLPPA